MLSIQNIASIVQCCSDYDRYLFHLRVTIVASLLHFSRKSFTVVTCVILRFPFCFCGLPIFYQFDSAYRVTIEYVFRNYTTRAIWSIDINIYSYMVQMCFRCPCFLLECWARRPKNRVIKISGHFVKNSLAKRQELRQMKI